MDAQTQTLHVPHVRVPEWRQPSTDDFDRLAAGVTGPVVLKGCLERWPIVTQLYEAADPEAQLAVLERAVGRARLHYTTLPPTEHGHLGYRPDGAGANFTFNTTKKKVDFSEFSQVIRSVLRDPGRGAVYMQSAPLDRFPALQTQVPDLPYLQKGLAGYRQLWIGSGGHVVNLHFDPTHNLIAMLAGQKRVTLLPPDNMANMYPAPLDCRIGDTIGSLVRLLEPDPDKYPRAEAELAKAQVAELSPGDVLYLPPLWWHHVESFGLNVMINKWVPPISGTDFGDLTANVIDGILTYRPLPASLRLQYRELYRGVVFGQPPARLAAPDPRGAAADEGRVDAAMMAAANHHLLQAWRTMRGVPDCLRAVVPQLYDYYVFQVDGPPALSRGNEEAFLRSLRRYSRALRAVSSIQRWFGR